MLSFFDFPFASGRRNTDMQVTLFRCRGGPGPLRRQFSGTSCFFDPNICFDSRRGLLLEKLGNQNKLNIVHDHAGGYRVD